jgi:fido (protein-threonine AMPylation protein)
MIVSANDEPDPERTFSESEERFLSQQLYSIAWRVRVHDSKQVAYSINLLCDWHRLLFAGVRSHAGRMRSLNYGEDYVVFPPYRSCHKSDVTKLMETHIQQASELGQQMQAGDVDDVLRGALYIHADLIHIHPFRDGNGRTARLALSYWLCRCGLIPIPFEVVKADYISTLGAFFDSGRRDMAQLYSLAIRLLNAEMQRMR